MKKYITVFTGAGISACSGVQTFRDADGLWEGHKVEEVATPKGFEKDPQLVWDFYRARYQQLQEVEPNNAHYALVQLEEQAIKRGYEFLIITQNIDGLHHRAGSKNAVEIHGDLRTLRCCGDHPHHEECTFTTEDIQYWNSNIVPICPVCNSLLRVNVVWFGEMLPDKTFLKAEWAAKNSQIMLVIGTSGVVQPAASLVSYVSNRNGKIFECNPTPAFDHLSYDFDPSKYRCLRGKASSVVPTAVKEILAQI